ncbi:MAG: DUF1549 domain-containing protein, partial [Bythopirellula sp.]
MFRNSLVLLLGVGPLAWSVQPVLGESASSEASRGGDTSISSAVPVDYLRDIRPILSDSCYACHGPDEASREAELRLDQPDFLLAENDSQHPIVLRGDPDQSELWRRISSDDPDELMPPADSGKTLTAEQIQLIRRWVAQGASWKQHWAFLTPLRPEVPQVSDASWAENAIDRFILAQLERRGWQPSPAADKEILIRRVTFDLTGLPPTLEEVDAFLADDSPQAYERVVDRLLHSPHYGEHMARFWLDAARYGDTHGLHLDNYREMWPYRDWVVQSFNINMPYDQFVIEQLAGDLLPEPALSQLVATGFCRAHVTTNEGGSIEQEVFTRNVVDRVSTTGTVFMGLTLGCAVCHDHKFDPVTQQEFYQLFAFFNSLDGPALDGNVKDPAPVVSVPSELQAANLTALRESIAEVRAKRAARQAVANADFTEWTGDRIQRAQQGGFDQELHVADGLVVHCKLDEDSGNRVTNHADPNKPGRFVGAVNRIDGYQGGGVEFPKDSHIDLGNVGNFNDDEPFSYGLWVRPSNGRNRVVLAKTDATMLHRGYELALIDGQVKTRLSRRQPGYVIKVTTKESHVPNNEWHHIFVTYDGSKRASGVVIYVDGQPQEVTVWSDAIQFKGGIRNSRPLLIGNRDQGRGFEGGQVDEVRVYGRRLTDADVRAVYLESQLDFLNTSRETWTKQDQDTLEHFFLLRQDEQ